MYFLKDELIRIIKQRKVYNERIQKSTKDLRSNKRKVSERYEIIEVNVKKK